MLAPARSQISTLVSSSTQLWTPACATTQKKPHVCTDLSVCLSVRLPLIVSLTADSILHTALVGVPLVGALCGGHQWDHLCLLLAGGNPPLHPHCPPWHGRHCAGMLPHRRQDMWSYGANLPVIKNCLENLAPLAWDKLCILCVLYGMPQVAFGYCLLWHTLRALWHRQMIGSCLQG